MRSKAILLTLLLAGSMFGQQDSSERQELINGIKDLQRQLGLEQTRNFARSSNNLTAYHRCYYTGKLELPASYDDLRLIQGDQAGCSVDETKYDVFFYPIEAVANGKAPITASLAEATLERAAVVVAHEDFHEQKPIQGLPTPIAEAGATLIGFLTAAEYARQQSGAGSQQYQNLSQEAELFRRKSELLDRYYEKLRSLYASVRSGAISKEKALPMKQRLFGQLDDECRAGPDAVSFNKCVSASNNAGLAFDYTYTKHYPLLYQVFLSQGRELRKTIETINRAPARGSLTEAQAVEYFREIVRSDVAQD